VLHGSSGQRLAFFGLAELASTPLVEQYARGNDLVASYAASDTYPFGCQVYWSVGSCGEGLSLELLVSVQTDLLDTHPVVHVAGPQPLGSSDTLVVDGDELLAATTGDAMLVLGVHPSDGGECDRAAENRWQLFAHFLEKGVIRRARLFAALVPAHDPSLAREAYRQFLRKPLPLTV
jgi:hypothetical protein